MAASTGSSRFASCSIKFGIERGVNGVIPSSPACMVRNDDCTVESIYTSRNKRGRTSWSTKEERDESGSGTILFMVGDRAIEKGFRRAVLALSASAVKKGESCSLQNKSEHHIY